MSVASAISVMIILAIIHKVEPHVWLAFYGLVGMEFVLTFMEESHFSNTFQKVAALLFSIAAIAAVYCLFKCFSLASFLSETKFTMIPLMIVWSSNFSIKMIKNKDLKDSLVA